MRRRLAWAVALALLAAPGLSAEGDADRLAVCLDANGERDAPGLVAACAGEISQPCLAGTEQTITDISECVTREHAAWDALLTRYWTSLRESAEEAGTFDTLLAAQSAWIEFRDAECAHVYAAFGDGTYRTIAGAYCRRDLTARRTVDLYRPAFADPGVPAPARCTPKRCGDVPE